MKDTNKWDVIEAALLGGVVLSAFGLWRSSRSQTSNQHGTRTVESEGCPGKGNPAMASTTSKRAQREYVATAFYLEERARKAKRVAVQLGIAFVALVAGSLAMDRFLSESANPALPTLVSVTAVAGVLSLLGACATGMFVLFNLNGASRARLLASEPPPRGA